MSRKKTQVRLDSAVTEEDGSVGMGMPGAAPMDEQPTREANTIDLRQLMKPLRSGAAWKEL